MATKTNALPEREYIAILGLVMPLVDAKRSQSLTPADFDARSYALEVVEALATQRLDTSLAAQEPTPPVVPDAPAPEVHENE